MVNDLAMVRILPSGLLGLDYNPLMILEKRNKPMHTLVTNFVTITPLHLDLTAYPLMDTLREWQSKN
jgi:hypothetical protein